MADTTPHIENPQFTSRAFPTAEDMTLWQSLSPAAQLEVIERDEEAGFQSGVAPHESLADRLARVRRA